MRVLISVISGLCFMLVTDFAVAEKGFSIEGGLVIQDHPTGEARNKPYRGLNAGLGYTAIFGYDFTEKLGVELGVAHTGHDYRYAVIGGAVIEETADRNAFFLRARLFPVKIKKFELLAAVGPAFFDISGTRENQGEGFSEDFSGVGFGAILGGRYYMTDGLAVTIFVSGNSVKYTRYELLGYRYTYPGGLPRGDSIAWGLTLFHRIGAPHF